MVSAGHMMRSAAESLSLAKKRCERERTLCECMQDSQFLEAGLACFRGFVEAAVGKAHDACGTIGSQVSGS